MNPVIFQTNFFTLHTIWIFFALAIIAITFSIIRLSVVNNLKLSFFSEHSWKLILWAILGARILFIIENFNLYFSDFSKETFLNLFAIWDKGLNVWGAIFAALIAFYFLCKKHEQDFFKWLDILVPSIIIGLAFGHIGSFFEGTNYGSPTGLPWGVNFESPAIKYTVPIHPTQIYAFIYSALVFSGLIFLSKTKFFKEKETGGLIGLLGITVYGFFSFLEEFLRGDDTLTLFDIRISQVLTLLVTITSGIFLYLRYNSTTKKRH